MKIGKEIYKCDKCKEDHYVDYPIAESDEEYKKIISQLPRPFMEDENGNCRTMRICNIGGCTQENGEPHLGRN